MGASRPKLSAVSTKPSFVTHHSNLTGIMKLRVYIYTYTDAYIDGLDMRVRVRLARLRLARVGVRVGVRVVRLGVGLGHT